jgi:ATP-dependent DNA ligase
VRRTRLVDALADVPPPVHVTRTTTDPAEAEEWFGRFEGAGLDGVVAKPLAAPYQPNSRTMLKVKHERTADVVVAGYRLHKTSTPDKPLLGSLLLGLYDGRGTLQHVGVSASFTASRRAELVEQLHQLVVDPADHPWGGWAKAEHHHVTGSRMPGAQSRWSAGKDLSFVPLDPRLVLEVAYDHMEGTRFRHTAQFRRWRPDREPESCTYEQLEEPVGYDLASVLSSSSS